MKILNSKTISPFGGLNFVIEEAIKLEINKLLKENLPVLPKQSTYNWFDIIMSYWSVFFLWRRLCRSGKKEDSKHIIKPGCKPYQIKKSDNFLQLWILHFKFCYGYFTDCAALNPRLLGNGHLTPSIDIVQRMMKVFAVSADQLLNDNQNSVVEIQNHELNEQLAFISQLDEDEKNALVKIINSMLTKKRMKDLLDGKINLNQ